MLSKTHLHIFDCQAKVDTRYSIEKVEGLNLYIPLFCNIDLSDKAISLARALFMCKQHQIQQELSSYE